MKRILLVDDDPDILDSLAELLSENYSVATARNGVRALERARAEPFDAIVLDLMMPMLDGRGFIRAYREQGGQVPVLLASASRNLSEICKEVAAADFLEKPFSWNELEVKLQRIFVKAGGGGGSSPGPDSSAAGSVALVTGAHGPPPSPDEKEEKDFLSLRANRRTRLIPPAWLRIAAPRAGLRAPRR